MAKILYGPTTIDAPDLVQYDAVKDAILKASREGTYDWFEYVGANANVSLLIGPGIPFAFVDDAPTRQHPDLSDSRIEEFIAPSADGSTGN